MDILPTVALVCEGFVITSPYSTIWWPRFVHRIQFFFHRHFKMNWKLWAVIAALAFEALLVPAIIWKVSNRGFYPSSKLLPRQQFGVVPDLCALKLVVGKRQYAHGVFHEFHLRSSKTCVRTYSMCPSTA